ncbi:MAG TPA: TrkH family potassium uptake protein [Candidatus Faecaligallichristensenella faecipullorum]|nr:TrkH family potassium uptake protein [Candidatus Faecaligallichristensenella faecipullorum]
MNFALVSQLLGKVLMLEGAMMAPSLLVSLLYGGSDAPAFLWSMAMVLAAGGLLALIKPKNDQLRAREGFVVVSVSWILLSVFGAMPFVLSGAIPSFVDSFFECVSGFTTTGSTLLPDVESLPRGVLFWRSFTHWIGGMGVLVLSLALVPKMGARSLHLLRAESPGPNPGKLVPRIGNTAKILYTIYVALTLVQILLLLIAGMPLYDSLVHSFGSAGTGGFSIYNLSIGHYQNPVFENIIAVFMMLFGINFTVYYQLITRNFKGVLKNGELWLYLGIIVAATLLIALNILPTIEGNLFDALRLSYFQVSSVITTTGYATTDFNLWPQFSRYLLVLLMFVGACAGSTGGGIKVIRLEILLKSLARDVKRTIHPRGVKVVKSEGRAVDEPTINSITVFFFSYIFIILMATLLVSLDGLSFETSFTATVSAMGNIGPGLDKVGPMGNFSCFSPFSKIVLSLCMLAGRLEIYPILMLVTPATWKKA